MEVDVQGNVGCIVDPELVLAQQTYSGMSLYYDSAPRLPPRFLQIGKCFKIQFDLI